MRKTASALALLNVVLGATVLFGWHINSIPLIQVRESFVPMQYITALGFCFLGVSLLLASSGRAGWGAIAAVPFTLFGSLTLIEYVLGISLRIDELIAGHHVTVESSHPGRMAPNTALCFLLCGTAISCSHIIQPARHWARWAGLQASATLALAFVALSGYAAGVESAYGWGQLNQMSVHTSVGFLLAGSAIFLLALSASESVILARWISISVGIGLIAAGFGLWQALADEQNKRIRTQLDSRSRELLTVINFGIESRVTALERMAHRWTDDSPDQEKLWRKDAAAYIDTIPGFQAIEWVDDNRVVRWVEPMEGNEQAVGLKLDEEANRRNALHQAVTQNRPKATNAIDLVQGGKGFLLFVPIVRDNAFDGFILAAFRIAPLFDSLTESVSNDFEVAILQDETTIYGSTQFRGGSMHSLPLLGNTWQIQLTPKPAYLGLLKSTLPSQVLFGSVAVSILAGAAIFLAQTAYKNLKKAQCAEQSLRESEAYHRGVVEELPIGLLTVSEGGVILSANQGALRLFGYEQSELVGESVHILVPTAVRGNHPVYVSQYMRDPKPRAMGKGRELFARTKQGHEIPVEIGLAPLRHNGSVHALVSIVDISLRKRAEDALAKLNLELEERVQSRTAELEAANKELDQFTYIASHDLQEPLRKQQMFTAILNEEVGDDIGEDALRAMQAINNASVRMQDLIQSLLALSRARNRELNMRSVGLTQLVDDAVNSLSLLISETNARIKVGQLPEVTCDPILVTQVFQNMIGNGVRFAKAGEEPVIVINAHRRNGLVEVELRDFGIGIPAESLDKIFAAFKRLHARHEYPGTGIGLSICKKVVERHGGRIWVESEIGNGSTFRFTLSETPRGSRYADRGSTRSDNLVGRG